MLGSTPPDAMVTEPRSLFSSSSLRTASWMWRGTMRVFLLSRAALPGGRGEPRDRARAEHASTRVCRSQWTASLDARFKSCATPLRAGELEDLGAEIFEYGTHIDPGADADARGVLALAHVAVEPRHRELEAGLGRRRGRLARGLSFAAATFSFARHDEECVFLIAMCKLLWNTSKLGSIHVWVLCKSFILWPGSNLPRPTHRTKTPSSL